MCICYLGSCNPFANLIIELLFEIVRISSKTHTKTLFETVLLQWGMEVMEKLIGHPDKK